MFFRLLLPTFLITSVICRAQDLQFGAYTGPTNFAQYEEVSLTCDIKNAGIVPITGRILGHAYLSSDPILNYGDPGYAHGYRTDLNQDQTVSFDIAGSFDVSPGTYYLILELDYYHEQQETDEDNNILVISNVVVTAPNVDWQFNSLSPVLGIPSGDGDPEFFIGDYIQVDYEFANTGSTNAGKSIHVSFHLSHDNVLNEGDIALGATRHFTDGVDVFSAHPGGYLIPNVTPGIYYVIGVVDESDSFDEIDESNNVAVTSRVAVATGNLDLFASDINGVSYDVGYLHGYYWVNNLGSTGAGGYQTSIYLSVDEFLGPDDFEFSPYPYDSPYVPAGGREFAYFNANSVYYQDVPPGVYYVIVYVNPNNALPESNTANNITVSSYPLVSITEPPAVSLTHAGFVGAYENIDLSLTLEFGLSNIGGYAGGTYSFGVQITDQDGNVSRNLGFNQWVDLFDGQSQTYQQSLALTSQLEAGIYTVTLSCSSPGYISSPEQITLVISEHEDTISGLIKGEDGVAINQGKLFLYRKHEDGTVSFINKKIYTTSNDFEFATDEYPHTLFYIPNPVAYPEYVPTIYGKTVTLSDDNFFILTGDLNADFEILKVVPMAAGSMSISGNIKSASSSASEMSAMQRITTLTKESVEGFPVVLLSSAGEPVAVTTADADGNYQFNGLPNEVFGLVVALELDQPVMLEPIAVDITDHHAVVDFDLSGEEVESQLHFQQEITFEPLEEVSFDMMTIQPVLSASSGLPVTLQSSDINIARIEGESIVIVGAGTATITAIQSGSDLYAEATPVTRDLTVNKASQLLTVTKVNEQTFGAVASLDLSASSTSGLPVVIDSDNPGVARINGTAIEIVGAGSTTITVSQPGNANFLAATPEIWELEIYKASQSINMADIASKIYGDADFAITASATSGLNLTFTSSDDNIASVTNGMVTIKSAGTVTITAQQTGNSNFDEAVTVAKTLTINKHQLSLEVSDIPDKTFGDAPFALEIENTSSFPATVVSLNTDVLALSDDNKLQIRSAGVAEIVVTLAGDVNHEGISVNKFVNVSKADQSINFETLPAVNFGETEEYDLVASATSSLPLIFSSSNPDVAMVEGTHLTIIGPGEVTIIATQPGNQNYNAAESVSQLLRVNVVAGIETHDVKVQAFPNPVLDFLKLETSFPIIRLSTTNVNGIESNLVLLDDNVVDMRLLPAGLFVIHIYGKNHEAVIRVIKK